MHLRIRLCTLRVHNKLSLSTSYLSHLPHTSLTHPGYTEIASKLPPGVVMDMLNRLYSEFDRLAKEHGIFKVETVSDGCSYYSNHIINICCMYEIEFRIILDVGMESTLRDCCAS